MASGNKVRLHIGLFISESIGLLFWLAATYSLFLVVKKDELLSLYDISELPQSFDGISYGQLYSDTFTWLIYTRFAVLLLVSLLLVLKKHEGQQLWFHGIFICPIGFGIFAIKASEYLYSYGYRFMSSFSSATFFNNGFLMAIFMFIGAFFLFINSKPVAKTIYEILKKPFFGRFRVPWKNPLSEEDTALWEALDIQSKSGANIKALWRQVKEARGTIVLGHPMGKAAKGVFLKNGHAQRLIDKGFNVMVFDFNGFGESEMGNFDYYDDAEAVAQKAKEKSNGLPLGYHGQSLGGMWVCPTLSKDNNPFEYVIIESAATTLPEFWIHYPLAYKLLKLWFFFTPKKAKHISFIDHIPRLKHVKKLFLIYSDADKYSPLEMGERYQKAANIETELWNASGSEHALAFKSHPDEYWDKVVGFFSQNIKKD